MRITLKFILSQKGIEIWIQLGEQEGQAVVLRKMEI